MATEFSVILLVDDGTARFIEQLREMLPVTPIRNDKPHITLQNRILNNKTMSDVELTSDVKSALPEINFPIKVKYSTSEDHSSEKYGDSSVIRVSVENDLLDLKHKLVGHLKANGYELNKEFSNVYEPHITVGLGVPFTKPMLIKAKELLEGKEFKLIQLAIHRFYEKDGKRLVKTLKAENV